MRILEDGNGDKSRTEIAVLIKNEMLAIKKSAENDPTTAIASAFTLYASHNFKVCFYENK